MPPVTIRQRTLGERAVRGGRRLALELDAAGSEIPAVLHLPAGDGPHPAVLLLHGLRSRKEHLADAAGPALLARGVASLAVDLPLHGDRFDQRGVAEARSPLAALGLWRAARRETRAAAGYLRARAEVDGGRTAVLGYSLGSFLALELAAEERRVRAVVVAAGGDLPAHAFAAAVRVVADPLRAARRIGDRPLLVVHGRRDATMPPAGAERLFAAASEPKELRWYDAGHILPTAVIDDVAGWLAARLG